MQINADQLLENAIRDGLREGVKQRLAVTYNNPLEKVINAAITGRAGEFREILDEGLASCVGDPDFREEIKSSVRTILARTLVQRFGGELEKQVNALKSDPATRARITIAIEDIVKSKA